MTPEQVALIETSAKALKESSEMGAPVAAEVTMIYYNAGKKAGMPDSLAETFALEMIRGGPPLAVEMK